MINIKKQNFVSERYYNPPPKKYQVPFSTKALIFFAFLFCIVTYISFMVYKKNVQNNFIASLNSDYVNLEKIKASNIIDNKSLNLANYKKEYNFILLNFWASWCSACMQEMPSLIKLSKELEDKLLVIAISLDDKIDPVKKYADSIENKLLIAWDEHKSSLPIFNIIRYPETFLIGPDNKIIKQFSGAINWDKEKILKYLK